MESGRKDERTAESRGGLEVHQEFSGEPVYLAVGAVRDFRVAAADALGLRSTGLIHAATLPETLDLLRRDFRKFNERVNEKTPEDPYFNSTYFPVKQFRGPKAEKIVEAIQKEKKRWQCFAEYLIELAKDDLIDSHRNAARKVLDLSTAEDVDQACIKVFRKKAKDVEWAEAGKFLHHWMLLVFSRLPIRGQITEPLFKRLSEKLPSKGEDSSLLGFLIYLDHEKAKIPSLPPYRVYDLSLNVKSTDFATDMKEQPPPCFPKVEGYGCDETVMKEIYLKFLLGLFFDERFNPLSAFDGDSKESSETPPEWLLLLPLYDGWSIESGFEGAFRGFLFGLYPMLPSEGEGSRCFSPDFLDCLKESNSQKGVEGKESSESEELRKTVLKENVLKSISSQVAVLLLASDRLADELRRAEQDAILNSSFEAISDIPELIRNGVRQIEGWEGRIYEGEEQPSWEFYEDFPRDENGDPYDDRDEVSLALNLSRGWPQDEDEKGLLMQFDPEPHPLTIIPSRELVSAEIYFDKLATRIRRLYREFEFAIGRQQIGKEDAAQDHHAAMAHEMRKVVRRISRKTPTWALNGIRSYFYSLTVSGRDFSSQYEGDLPWLRWGALDNKIDGENVWPDKLCDGRDFCEWLYYHAAIAQQIQSFVGIVEMEAIPTEDPTNKFRSDFSIDSSCKDYLITDKYQRDTKNPEGLQAALGFACAAICVLRNVLQNKEEDTLAEMSIEESKDTPRQYVLVIKNEGKAGRRASSKAERNVGGTETAMRNFISFYCNEKYSNQRRIAEIKFPVKTMPDGFFRTVFPIPDEFITPKEH